MVKVGDLGCCKILEKPDEVVTSEYGASAQPHRLAIIHIHAYVATLMHAHIHEQAHTVIINGTR